MASLYRIRDDGSAADCWVIGRQPLVVGRGENANARVPDHTVSREHFTIARDREGYVIEDLDSNNGTWVDGRRIRMAWLNPGDCIVAGQTIFIFQVVPRTARAAAPDLRLDSCLNSDTAQIVPPSAAWGWPESWLPCEVNHDMHEEVELQA